MKLLALALVLVLAAQDEKITLKFNPRKGDKLVRTQKLEVQLKMSVDAGGQTQEIEFEQRGTSKRTREFADVADGKMTRLVLDVTEDEEGRRRRTWNGTGRTTRCTAGRSRSP